MRISLIGAFALACMIAAPILAEDSEVRTRSEQQMAQFKTAHPGALFYGQQYFDGEGFFEIDGTADYIYGTVLATGESAETSAWNLYEQLEGIYCEEVGDLVPGPLQGVMFDKATNQHRFSTFRFQQTVQGVPVYRSGIGFLVRNEENFPVVLASNNFKEMVGFDAAAAAFVMPKATPVMLQNATELIESSPLFQGGPPPLKSVLRGRQAKNRKQFPTVATDEELVIWAGVTNVKVQPQLAIKFYAVQGVPTDAENYRRQLIVAAVNGGAILYSENQIVADIDGTVSGRASDGVGALECHPEVPFALPYAEVQILGGATTFADVDGNFSLSSADGDVTVRSPLRGQWFEVFDDTAGGSTPFLDINLASPDSIDILHNPGGTEFATSNVNTYLHANIVRDFVLSFEPNFPTIATQTAFDITSNNDDISGITSCNATYSGVAINFMRNLGDCNNTSIPDIVYHEYGHHLVDVTGNSQGQFGEGCGDAMGVLIDDKPELAFGFVEGQCNNGIRTAEAFRTYPCFDQTSPHDCGQLLSGCVWDTVNEIRKTDPTNARDIVAELFVGMLIVRGQTGGSSMIGPEITLIFLALDDDDLSIANGTPHFEPIADAFNAHNMMAPELFPVAIEFPDGVPTSLDVNGGDTFEVNITSQVADALPGTGMLNYNEGNGFVQIPMTVIDADTYLAQFPQTCGMVDFFVSVETTDGLATSPTNAPVETFVALTANPIDLIFVDSFDSNLGGYTVTGNATDGHWQRGIPNNGDRGDPFVDAEPTGAGYCYVTDNGNTASNNNTDVDNGSVILTSPVLDATEGPDGQAIVSYFRWYSNDFGGSPNADVFVVEISNDGGATWVNVETVGPDGPEVSGGWIQRSFRVSDFVVPNDNIRLRFNASDLGEASIVEAGVDRLEINLVDCATEPNVLLGDVNLDGEVNLLDVQPFVDIITDNGFQAEADVNQDGSVDLLDVAEFVLLLTGG